MTDNYWEAVNFVAPRKEDLDIDYIYEYMAIPYPLLNRTFIKNIKILLPNSILEFSFKDFVIEEKELFSVFYSCDKSDIEEQLNIFNDALEKTMVRIKNECGDVRYGVGISGGLDSRIIPHFAEKAKMDLYGFIFGVKRPHKLFLLQDHSNARKIAKRCGLALFEVEWEQSTWSEKINQELHYLPLGPVELFKFEILDRFDVLIHGGNGYVVGSSLPSNIETMNEDELADAIRKLGIIFYPKTLLSTRIEKAVKFLFKKSITIKTDREWFSRILSNDVEERIKRDIMQFIKDEKKQRT